MIIGFNGAASANDKQYGNARAKLWWGVRMLFQQWQIDMSNADNQMDLEAQLLQPRYYIKKGKIFIEAKEEIKARIGRSPDNADAFMYSLLPSLTSKQLTLSPPPRNQQVVTRHALNGSTMTGSTRLVRQRS
jgi:hypothetical protein